MSNPYLSRITVTRITPINSANVKAFASVQLGNTLTIHGVKIVQQAGQKAYVRLPDQKPPNGERWFPVVESVDQQFMDAVQEKVLAAWQDATVTGQTATASARERW